MGAQLVSLDHHIPDCDTALDSFPIVLGMALDAGIRLNDSSISNYHCEIDRQGEDLFVRDLGSVHGTYVNGCRVVESRLVPGDQLGVGLMTFQVWHIQEQGSSTKEGRRSEHWGRATKPARRLHPELESSARRVRWGSPDVVNSARPASA